MARAHRVSGLRGSSLQGPSSLQASMLAHHYGLMDYDAAGNYFPSASDIAAGGITTPIMASPSGGSSWGGITPTEATLFSQAINAAGQIGVKAVSPTPTLTYGPGGYVTASGGAALPTSFLTSTTLMSYLPWVLGLGGLFLVVSMARR